MTAFRAAAKCKMVPSCRRGAKASSPAILRGSLRREHQWAKDAPCRDARDGAKKRKILPSCGRPPGQSGCSKIGAVAPRLGSFFVPSHFCCGPTPHLRRLSCAVQRYVHNKLAVRGCLAVLAACLSERKRSKCGTMPKARAAGAPRLHSSTPAVLVATALLLGCAVPPLPSAGASSTGRFPAPSSASLATLRRSGHFWRRDEEQEGLQMPLTTVAAPRGRGSGRTSPSWFAAQTTRGGGIFRRRRGGVGGGGRPASKADEKRKDGAEAGKNEKQGTSEGFAVAAGTTGGGGEGGDGSTSVEGQEEEGETTEGEDGGGSESDDEVRACVCLWSGL